MKHIYLLFGLAQSERIIKNINIPACKNCVYYQPKYYNSDFTSPLNRCSKYGYKDIITDEITYDFADLCRKDENKCGEKGKSFEEEKNINLKILKYKISSNMPHIALLCFPLYITILTILLKQK